MSLPVIGISSRTERSARPPNISLFAIAQSYVRATEMNGGTPLIIPPYLGEDQLRATFEHIDGLILSGGGDIHPHAYKEEDEGVLWHVDELRDRTEILLATWALTENKPLLAICRGAQVLNVAAGGTLVQDISVHIPDALSHTCIAGQPLPEIAHLIEVEGDSKLGSLIGADQTGVNSAHHQAIKSVGKGLNVVARAPDGVIEAVEAPERVFCLGVQWHPEVMVDEHPAMCRLFEGLAEAGRQV
jgi:putative glutamine amidotransferase